MVAACGRGHRACVAGPRICDSPIIIKASPVVIEKSILQLIVARIQDKYDGWSRTISECRARMPVASAELPWKHSTNA
jgi:hypothetical protein